MFGLDARIALAIFGALSVISGAALYNAIQNTKITTHIHEHNELAKAIEAYLLDVGDLPPISTVRPSNIMTGNLVENLAGVSNWNGPYLDAKYVVSSDGNGDWVRKIGVGGLKLALVRASDYSSCTVSSCYVWTRIDIDSNEEKLIRSVDMKIDNEYSSTEGDYVYPLGSNYMTHKKQFAINYNMVF